MLSLRTIVVSGAAIVLVLGALASRGSVSDELECWQPSASNRSSPSTQSPLSGCPESQTRDQPSALWLLKDSELLAINWNYDYVDRRFSSSFNDDSSDRRMSNIIRTGNIAKLFYYFTYKFDSPLEGVENWQLEQLAAGPKVNDTLCDEHLRELLHQLDEMKDILRRRRQRKDAKFEERHLRLVDLLDSFGRYEGGLMMGRALLLGSHTQCKGSQLLLDGQLVASRYCVANLDATKHQDANLRFIKDRMQESEPAEDVISVGICLPESCHTKSFAANKPQLQALVDSQFQLPDAMFQEQHLPLESIFCELDPDSELARLPVSGKLLLLFVLAWLAAALYATYHNYGHTGSDQDCSKTKEQEDRTPSLIRSGLLPSLNLRESWQDFIGLSEKRSFEGAQHRVSLDTLNPIKVFGSMFVVFGHSMMAHSGVASNTVEALKYMQANPAIYFVQGGTVIVDTFYVITGLVIAFIAMKRFEAPSGGSSKAAREANKEEEEAEADKTRRQTVSIISRGRTFLLQCLSVVASRFVRLLPLYFLVFWFKKSLMTSLSSGPLWDHGYNKETEAGSCREESWLSPFSFQAAYLPLAKQCMPQAWSVAGDLFFSLIVAPILVLMTSRPIVAALLASLMCLGSNLSMLMAYFGIDPQLRQDALELRLIAVSRLFKVCSFIYTAPHYRVFSILVGVLAGYVLYHYGRATDESHKLRHWPAWLTGIATKASLTYVLLTLVTAPLVPAIKASLLGRLALHRLLVMHMLTTNRLLWALSNAIIFLRMVTDWKDRYWCRQSAGKLWSSLAKLNFAILLVHVDLLKLDTYNQLNVLYYSFYNVIRLFAHAYLFSLIIAVVLFVGFENPMDKFSKQMRANKR